MRADLKRFDSDPDALAWARETVQRHVDRCRDFERQAKERGNEELAERWRLLANAMRMWFIGGEGCVIAAFDERRPSLAEALARSRETPKPDHVERGGHPGEQDITTARLPRLPDGPGPGGDVGTKP